MLYKFLSFSLYVEYMVKNRGRSQNQSLVIFSCLNHTNKMRLRFWLQLRPLHFGLYNEEIKNVRQFLTFSLYCLGLRIGSKPKPEPAADS
jgi:hypothetical protein